MRDGRSLGVLRLSPDHAKQERCSLGRGRHQNELADFSPPDASAMRLQAQASPQGLASLSPLAAHERQARRRLSVSRLLHLVRQHDSHVTDWVDWLERAAIMEFDGALNRQRAENAATQIMTARGG